MTFSGAKKTICFMQDETQMAVHGSGRSGGLGFGIGAHPLTLDNGSATNQAIERGRHEGIARADASASNRGKLFNHSAPVTLVCVACVLDCASGAGGVAAAVAVVVSGDARTTKRPVPISACFNSVICWAVSARGSVWVSGCGAMGLEKAVRALANRAANARTGLAIDSLRSGGLGFAGRCPCKGRAKTGASNSGQRFEGCGVLCGDEALALPVIHGLLGDAQ